MNRDPISALESHFETLDIRTSNSFQMRVREELVDSTRMPNLSTGIRSLPPLAAILLAPSILAGFAGHTVVERSRDELLEVGSIVAELRDEVGG